MYIYIDIVDRPRMFEKSGRTCRIVDMQRVSAIEPPCVGAGDAKLVADL
jgi:hypothetical protein